MYWLVLILIAVVAIPLVREAGRPAIGARARRDAPGQFVDLSQGITHYTWYGKSRGPVIVAIHGLTTPSRVWEPIAAGLVGLGYRVLTYDLYGRGLSDAPQGRQDRAFFLRQLTDLLADQGLAEDITLIGYSMGGSIATAFAAENPDRMKRLILVAPAGITMRESVLTRFCRQVPVLGDWLHAVAVPWIAWWDLKRRVAPAAFPEIVDVQLAQYKRKGFLRAVLSSRRAMLAEVQQDAHRKIGRDIIPTVAIWGDKDAVIPIKALGTLTQWNRAVRQEVVAGAGHDICVSHGSQVVEVLRDVLRED
jgi:pimeloyl-ACP methyl ester carboxylesterase